VPSLFTIRTAVPAAQVPLTRLCKAAPSTPSTRSAFKPLTFVVELTVNGATPPLATKLAAGPPARLVAYKAGVAAPLDFANTPIPAALFPNTPAPVELFVNDPVTVLLALFTPNPDAPAVAFVFVTCNCADGDAPASVVFASTEFDTPKLNTAPTPFPASANVEAPPTSTQTAPTATPFRNEPAIRCPLPGDRTACPPK
jgi:hypothetical protein